jgi:hypothetical protein
MLFVSWGCWPVEAGMGEEAAAAAGLLSPVQQPDPTQSQ